MADRLTDPATGMTIRLLPWTPTRDDTLYGVADLQVPQFALRITCYPWWHWRRWVVEYDALWTRWFRWLSNG